MHFSHLSLSQRRASCLLVALGMLVRTSNQTSRFSLGVLGVLAVWLGALSLGGEAHAQIHFDFPQGRVAGPRSLGVAVGDFERDGKLDVVKVGEFREADWTGCGNGFFCGGGSATNGVGGLRAIVTGDLNEDGAADSVATTEQTGEVHIRFGNPSPSLMVHQWYYVTSPTAIALADVTWDGLPDIITISSGGKFSTLVNQGNSTFANVTTTTSDQFSGSQALAVGILAGGDGFVTAAVANADGSVRFFSALRLGNTVAWQHWGTVTAGANPVAVRLADINFDNRLDVLTANADGNDVSVIAYQGMGTFDPAVSYAVGWRPVAMDVADVNNDLKPDIVTANHDSSDLTVLLGNGSGFDAGATISAFGASLAVALGDFNNDNNLDIFSCHEDGAEGNLFLGDGTGNFGSYGRASFVWSSTQPVTGDLNGDGFPDVVSVSGNSILAVLLNNGLGILMPPRLYFTGTTPVSDTHSVALGDVDNDGDLDIVHVGIYRALTVRLNDGHGNFDNGYTRYDFTVDITRLVLLDVNVDGKLDMVATSQNSLPGSTQVTTFFGDGTGNFTQGPSVTGPTDPTGMAVGDFNEDGKRDLAVTNGTQNTLTILRGTGSGDYFALVGHYATGANVRHVAVLDANHDGHLDLVTANAGSQSVSVLHGNGNGTFQPAVNYTVSGIVNWVEPIDADLDGDTDIAVAALWGDVVVLENNGAGGFSAKPPSFSGPNPHTLAVADVNQDGLPDLIAGHAEWELVVALRNTTDVRVLSGRVELQNCVNTFQALTFRFRRTNSNVTFTYTVIPNPDGTFTIPFIPAAHYRVAVKGAKWLRHEIAVDATNGDVSDLHFLLRAGDADNSNLVDVEDLSLLIQSFDADPTSPNWTDGMADFDCNTIVDVDDLSLLIQNFDAEGDA